MPRGYFFVGSKPVGFTHGGLTPEETIVPRLEFDTDLPTWTLLEVTYTGSSLRLGTQERVKLLLVNKNNIMVKKVRVRMRHCQIETELIDLAPETQRQVEIDMVIPKRLSDVEGDAFEVDCEVAYVAFGEEKGEHKVVRIPVRRLWQAKENWEFLG